jgi:hypothetical protein
VPETISIPARFNGPKESGNGGYSAGAVAQFLDGAAEVSLRAPVPLDTPLAVERASCAAAHEAQRSYRAPVDGPFSHCFVCGRAREDAFGVFAGVVEGRDLVASPWTPPEWTAGPDGHVRPEFLWAVLDCPTYFALYAHDDELPMSVLGRMTARVDGTATPGDEHVVIAWPLGREGRKHRAGAAVLSPGGTPIAVAEALLIELAPAQPS